MNEDLTKWRHIYFVHRLEDSMLLRGHSSPKRYIVQCIPNKISEGFMIKVGMLVLRFKQKF